MAEEEEEVADVEEGAEGEAAEGDDEAKQDDSDSNS